MASIHPGQLDGRPNVTLTDAGATLEATYLPGLGMVGCSLLHEDEQILELRRGPSAYAHSGSSFGIPLLHPWANRLAGFEYEAGGRRVHINPDSPRVHRDPGSGLPIHGLLTAHPGWEVLETTVQGPAARLRARFDFAAHDDLLAAFPFPHQLEYLATLEGSRLGIRLTVIPTADVPVPIAFGLHPYLRLPHTDRRRWVLELPVRRRLVLDERGLPTGAHEAVDPDTLSGPLGDRTFDDCFDRLERPADGGPVVFSLQDDRRRVSVELVEGYEAAQVFSPSQADFICLEPMTAPVNALADGAGLRFAAPDHSFSAEMAIVVTAVR